MRTGHWLAPAVAVLCGASWAAGGTIRADRNPALYTDLARLPRFDSVGLLTTTTTSSRELFTSGTLITPSIVLTAGHTFDNAASIRFNVGGATYAGAQWIAHPNWNGDLAAGWDIGLLQLAAPVTNIAPAVRYTGSGELGQVGYSVGFGMTGTGLTGAVTRDRRKRAGTNVIDTFFGSLTKNPRILLSDFDNPLNPADSTYGSRVPTNLEYLIASGDSGGGLFMNTQRGWRLAGVHTFGSATDGVNNADYGDFAGHTRVSLFNSWIDSMIRGFQPGRSGLLASRSGLLRGLDDPLTVPEPSAAWLALAGAAGIGSYVQRRRSRSTAAGTPCLASSGPSAV
jgi:hypothetical protein